MYNSSLVYFMFLEVLEVVEEYVERNNRNANEAV